MSLILFDLLVARRDNVPFSRSDCQIPARPLFRQAPYPFQRAVEMELFVRYVAKNCSVSSPRGLGLSIVPAQIHDIDVLGREVLQRFGE